jgi:hypothetical protein
MGLMLVELMQEIFVIRVDEAGSDHPSTPFFARLLAPVPLCLPLYENLLDRIFHNCYTNIVKMRFPLSSLQHAAS